MFAPHRLSEELKVVWQPQHGPQTDLVTCPVFEVFYGGARGGGKTESSIGDWLMHSSMYGEHAIGIFIRRTLKQLQEVIARTQQIFPKLGAKYHVQDKTWVMSNGARLKFVYLEKDVDAEEYQGHSYTRIYIEEVTNFPSPGPIDKMRATLRSGAGVPCGMRLTGNPGGPGHHWVKKRYIDPDKNGYRIIREKTRVIDENGQEQWVELDRIFIPSKLRDNKLLMRNDPTYVLRLHQAGSAALVRAWLEGDWDIIDGAFFDCFDPTIHILDHAELLKVMPHKAYRYRAFDWGSARPFSCGWYVVADGSWGMEGRGVFPAGAIIKYEEWYGAKAPNVGLKLPADEVARGIRIRERDNPWPVQGGVADPAIFIRNGGPSIADMMVVEGVNWGAADNKRVSGWAQLRQRLVGVDGRPLLYFSEMCHDSIRTLPAVQHDDTNMEDIDTDGEDHAADEIRYACMARPMVVQSQGKKLEESQKHVGNLTFQELLAMNTAKRQNQAGNFTY